MVPGKLSVGNLRNQYHLSLVVRLMFGLDFFFSCLHLKGEPPRYHHLRVFAFPVVDCQLYWKKTRGKASKAA